MRKALFTTGFLLLANMVFPQLLSFEFDGISGNEITVNSSGNATGVQPSAISRGSGVGATANAGRFNSNGWTTNAGIDVNDYLEFSIVPQPGYTIDIASIDIFHQRSGTGPVNFVFRISTDAYTADAANVVTIADVTATQNSNFIFTSAISVTSAITLRLYGYSAESGAGTWGPGDAPGNNDIMVNGTATPTALPVNFGMVKAARRPNSVYVEWNNLTESDINYYDVERSANGSGFISIAQVNARLNNGAAADYSFTDASAPAEIIFYRIAASEITGNVKYSPIVKVNTRGVATELVLYPNPVSDGRLNFQLTNLPEGRYIIRIFDIGRQNLYNYSLNHAGSSVTTAILLPPAIKPGIYTLQISSENMKLVKMFVVRF